MPELLRGPTPVRQGTRECDGTSVLAVQRSMIPLAPRRAGARSIGVRPLTRLLPFVLLGMGGCGYSSVEPVGGATSTVTLAVSYLPSSDGLPTLTFRGAPGAIEVVWDVQTGPCLLASAQQERSGTVMTLTLKRAGDPLALCVATLSNVRYHVRAPAAPRRAYLVRLVDDLLGQPPREVGRSWVTVR